MDIFISSSLLLILAILSCLFLFWFFPKPTNTKLNNLPPGKTGWPIIGESLEYFSLGKKGLPEKFIRERMEKYSADVFTTSLGGGENMAVFCGDVGNKFLFSNENKLIVTWWPPAISKIIHAAGASAEETKVVRNIVIEFIKRESLKVFTPLIDQTTREHFDAEWRGGQTEVKALDLARMMTFKLTCWLLMSMDDSKRVQRLLGIFGTVIAGFRSYPIDFPGTSFNRAVKAVELIKKDILQVIKQRQRGDNLPSQADLLSRLMDRHSKTGIHKTFIEEEIAHIIVGLLIAGHETTSIVLTSVIYFLADHPRVYAKVFEEQMKIAQSKGSTEELLSWEDVSNMKYSRNVINEVMRLVPPSPGGYKQVIREFRYGDFIIPKGWKTFWSVYSTHKDPKYFKNPEEFDPSRFEGDGPLPFTFIPFGGGPRMCPGYEYARLVILIFMHHLVTNFKWEKVFPNEIFTYTPFPIPEKGLPIRLSPHTL